MTVDYDTLFYSVDDFCKSFEPWYKKQLISVKRNKTRQRHGHLKLSEVLTILIAYHQSGMRGTQVLLSRFNLTSSSPLSEDRALRTIYGHDQTSITCFDLFAQKPNGQGQRLYVH